MMVMFELLIELGGGNIVSTFEFVRSGVVGTLLKFLSYGKDNMSTITLK